MTLTPRDGRGRFIVCMALLLMMTMPAVAVQEYPQEYSTLGTASNNLYNNALLTHSKYSTSYSFIGTTEGLISAYELRRQTILMERQNELIAEQNRLLGM